jgi:hypothetical protein
MEHAATTHNELDFKTNKNAKHKYLLEIPEMKMFLNKLVELNSDDIEISVEYKKVNENFYEVYHFGGNYLRFVFSNDGCIVHGFDHESNLSPHTGDVYEIRNGIYTFVPEKLLKLLKDSLDEDDYENVTFCIWRETGDPEWSQGKIDSKPDDDDGGFSFLLGLLSPKGR